MSNYIPQKVKHVITYPCRWRASWRRTWSTSCLSISTRLMDRRSRAPWRPPWKRWDAGHGNQDISSHPIYSIPWLLVTWRREEPGHQQAWCWKTPTSYVLGCQSSVGIMATDVRATWGTEALVDMVLDTADDLAMQQALSVTFVLQNADVYVTLLIFNRDQFFKWLSYRDILILDQRGQQHIYLNNDGWRMLCIPDLKHRKTWYRRLSPRLQ